MKIKRKKTSKSNPTIEQMVMAAHKAGLRISFGVTEHEHMPERFPSDPEPVKLLIEESERMSALGNKWDNAKIPNAKAANTCFQAGWAHALSAAWLRVKLNGELKRAQDTK